MKKDIQGMIDEMVRKYKDKVKQGDVIPLYCGVPLSEFNVDELIAIIDDHVSLVNRRCIGET